jgi:hypothetical protein
MWQNNVSIGLKETGREDMNWFYLAGDVSIVRVFVKTVMNFWAPLKAHSVLTD